MSVATEFPPVVHIPERARSHTEHMATVLAFRPRRAGDDTPAGSLRAAAASVPLVYPVRAAGRGTPAAPAALRLTRRGYVVVAVLVGLLTAGLLWLAHASVPADSTHVAGSGAAVVTVGPGDTLWSIATRIAPERDPRTVVAMLERVNHLSNPTLQPGQLLRTR